MNRTAYWLPAVVLLLGCGSAGDGEATDTGSINLALETNGVKLTHVTYTITGTDFSRTKDVDVTNSTRISALIGGLPVGHFDVALSATDESDPSTECEGSAEFDILPRQTSSAVVNLYCRKNSSTGSVAINGSVYRCPTIESLSAEPSEAVVGGDPITLSARAEDPDSTFVYAWTASGGSLDGASTPEPQLYCTSPGDVTVNLTVTGARGSCTDTAEATVYCSPSGPLEEPEDDPSTPGDDRAGFIACGEQSCTPGYLCCGHGVGCAASLQACIAAGAPDTIDYRSCDGPEDCAAPERCAVSRHWVSCGTPSFYGVICHTDLDCVSTPDHPNPCQPTGYCDGPFE